MFDRRFKSLVILVFLVLMVPVLGHSATLSEIETEFMCDCGCGDMLVNCTCERSDEMRGLISQMNNQGQSKTQIVANFVSQFGEVILSSPPRKGFNLVAYGVPMTGFFFGAIVAVTLARRWRFSRRDEEDEESESGDDLSEEMEERIREELENLED
ncbi:cytochrome c-type biogenesis protein CcmH [bacterium]|nr:cytochrome c-type biogenesis protein CcmH [bacterium]